MLLGVVVAVGCIIETETLELAASAPTAELSSSPGHAGEPVPTGTSVTAELAPTPEATGAPELTPRPEAAATPEPTVTPEATVTPEPTVTVEATATPEPTVTPEATATPEPTATPQPTPEPTATLEPTPTPDLLTYTSLRTVDCPPGSQDDTITCHMVTLPEDDENAADGRTVELFVSIIDNGDAVGAGPTVILQGGPGVAIASTGEEYVGAGLDVILVDQRGAGRSLPSLECTEFAGLFQKIAELASRDSAALQAQLEANQACRDRLVASGVRPAAYNSEQNADDIALLRRVLGYDEWNVYGSSYGTRLALTLLRDHPEGVRAVVLDAVLPLEVDFFGQVPANAERAIGALNSACVEAVTCASSYGDLAELLDAAAARFDAEPVTIPFTRPSTGEVLQAVIDGPAVRSFVFDQMYLVEEIAALPRRLQLAATGDVTELASRVLQRQDPSALDFAEAMYWSVFCAEEEAFHDTSIDDDVIARHPESFAVAHISGELAQVCAVWDVPDAPPVENEAVMSTTPALLFSGRLDPITPPAWAELVASTLENAVLVSLPRQSHGASNNCVGAVLAAFLATPTAAPDTSCIDTSPIDFD